MFLISSGPTKFIKIGSTGPFRHIFYNFRFAGLEPKYLCLVLHPHSKVVEHMKKANFV